MGHLSPDELLDIAEGMRPADSRPHVASCASCQEQLAGLRAAIADAADVEVPEPSPLFWDHLSARVRDAVAAEAAPRRSWLGGWSWPVVSLASAAGVAVLVVIVAISSRGLFHQAPALAPEVAPSVSVELSGAAAGEPFVEPDADPSFTFVADLTSDMDVDTALQAGLVSDGSADHAVAHLNERELRELERLVKDEIARAQAS